VGEIVREGPPEAHQCRIETVATSGMFRSAFAKHRVLVPASGYIEWTITETGKQPHYIYDPDAGLAMAGVLSFWPDPDKAEDDPDKWRETVAIITRDSHVAPGEVHDRMPALISPAAYDDWLGNHLTGDDLMTMLERESHSAAGNLTHYEVSRDINNVRNNNEQLIEPLPAATR
jgi:putative SOS response-associated peptidase YedK